VASDEGAATIAARAELRVTIEQYGEKSAESVEARMAVAEALIAEHRYSTSIPELVEAGKLSEELFGVHSWETLMPAQRLGYVLFQMGKFDKAVGVYRRLLAQTIQAWGAESSNALIVLRDLDVSLVRTRSTSEIEVTGMDVVNAHLAAERPAASAELPVIYQLGGIYRRFSSQTCAVCLYRRALNGCVAGRTRPNIAMKCFLGILIALPGTFLEREKQGASGSGTPSE